MKKIFYILPVMALAMASCTNFFDEKQLGNTGSNPYPAKTMEYTLSADEYKSITTNAKNIKLAEETIVDEDSTAYKAFLSIADDKAFSELAAADVYLPAYIYTKFPQLSLGSTLKVTYNFKEGLPAYLADLKEQTISVYALTTADYQLAWESETNFVEYLTPKTIAKTAAVLKERFAEAEEGNLIVLDYNYQEIEPVFGSVPEPEPTRNWLHVSEARSKYDAGELVKDDSVLVKGVITKMQFKPTNFVKYGSVNIYVADIADPTLELEFYNCYSLVADTFATSTPAYEEGSSSWGDFTAVTDRNGTTVHVGDTVIGAGKITLYGTTYELNTGCYLTECSYAASAPKRVAMAATGAQKAVYQFDGTKWAAFKSSKVNEVAIVTVDASKTVDFLRNNYPYANADDVYLAFVNGKNGYDVQEYVFNGITFVQTTGIVEETMPFVLDKEWLANLSVYYKQTIVGEGLGDLVLEHYDLQEGITYIWKYDALYGMKGTSYAGGAHTGDGWCITPAIKLKNSKKPALQFKHAINYAPEDMAIRAQELGVFVSTDYAGDASVATWKQLPWNEWSDETQTGLMSTNNWTFFYSGDMDLSEYNGQTIYIGFRYHAEEGWTCATWEFQDILVHEVE